MLQELEALPDSGGRTRLQWKVEQFMFAEVNRLDLEEVQRQERAILGLIKEQHQRVLAERRRLDEANTTMRGYMSKNQFAAHKRAMQDLGYGAWFDEAGREASGRDELDEMLEDENPWDVKYDAAGRLVLAPNLGKLEPGLRKLHVAVLGGKGLRAPGHAGTASHPYVQVSYDGAVVHRTRTQWNKENPTFGDEVTVKADPSTATYLHFEIFHHNRSGPHALVGKVDVAVDQIQFGRMCPARWIYLQHSVPAPAEVPGEVCMACYFDAEVPGRLHVQLVRAENLPAADANGLSDPYCVLQLVRGGGEDATSVHKLEDRKKAKVRYATLDPVWEQAFAFHEVKKRPSAFLLVEVWDNDTLAKDDPLGQFQVPVARIEQSRPQDRKARPFWVKLEPHASERRPMGSVNFEAYFADYSATRVFVKLRQATKLEPAETGLCNPYAVIRCGRGVKTTKIIPGTCTPRWDQEFAFVNIDTDRETALRPFDPDDVITIDICNKGGYFGEHLGRVVYPVSKLKPRAPGEVPRSFWVPVQDRAEVRPVMGSLLLHLYFEGKGRRREKGFGGGPEDPDSDEEREQREAAAKARKLSLFGISRSADAGPSRPAARPPAAPAEPTRNERLEQQKGRYEYDVRRPSPAEAGHMAGVFGGFAAWWYLDDHQGKRGPFAPAEMAAWHGAGYLKPDLLACGCAEGEGEPPVGYFAPLRTYGTGGGGHEALLPAQPVHGARARR